MIELKQLEYQKSTDERFDKVFQYIEDHAEEDGRGTETTLETENVGVNVEVNISISLANLQNTYSKKKYGRDAFAFEDNAIVVTISFNWVNKVGNKQKPLSQTRQTIISEMRNNMSL